MSTVALSLRTGLPRARRLATIQTVAPETMSDGELITLVGEGDPGAFELLYQRYARPVFALALRRLGDRGRAEDAVQETFASIWRSAGSYRRERGPGAPGLDDVARAPRARRAAGARAPADRARILERALPERDRRLHGHASRDRQDTDEERARAPRRHAGGRALMTGPPEFRDLVGDDLPAEERARLERVHELLMEAGPPPELPPSLAEAPDRAKQSPSWLPRRRFGTALALAAAI